MEHQKTTEEERRAMSEDVGVLYNDMQCGSVYAMIKWLRHPYVCGEQNRVIADLVETEIIHRNSIRFTFFGVSQVDKVIVYQLNLSYRR